MKQTIDRQDETIRGLQRELKETRETWSDKLDKVFKMLPAGKQLSDAAEVASDRNAAIAKQNIGASMASSTDEEETAEQSQGPQPEQESEPSREPPSQPETKERPSQPEIEQEYDRSFQQQHPADQASYQQDEPRKKWYDVFK